MPDSLVIDIMAKSLRQLALTGILKSFKQTACERAQSDSLDFKYVAANILFRI